MKRNIIFLVILPLTAIGLLLRVWNLKSNPPELFSDEIRGILSAKSMIESGKISMENPNFISTTGSNFTHRSTDT